MVHLVEWSYSAVVHLYYQLSKEEKFTKHQQGIRQSRFIDMQSEQ